MSAEVRLEDALGRPVIGPDGRSAGRLQEASAERQGDEYVVTSYVLGTRGLLVRLSLESWRTHEGGIGTGYRARWDQIDLSDPRKPRLTCRVEELERL